MKIGSFVALVLLQPFVVTLALSSPSSSFKMKKVALIGTTGQLGREAVCQLSKSGMVVKCLLRHDVAGTTPPASLDEAASSAEVAAFLSTLPNVEFVKGDINDDQALERLVRDTDACLALHGAGPPRPPIRSLLFPALLFPETDPTHAKQVNYVGIQRLLTAMTNSGTCRHLVRITGNGETPWSIFSILINAFGGMAKAWNYEAEQLIRNQSAIDYTIIRPGIMKKDDDGTGGKGGGSTLPALTLRDNGGALPVTVTTYGQIAALSIDCLRRPNMKRSTLAVMNSVDPAAKQGAATDSAVQTADQVRPDTRVFPASLLDEHRRAARAGGLVIVTVSASLLAWIVSLLVHLVSG
jgi:NAD(P)-dependent dehydrogenase (short-subunit alcohol dehydrogenase family)